MAVAWVNNAFNAVLATDGTTTAFGFTPANTFVVNDTVVFFIENGSVDQNVSSVTDGSNTYVVTNFAVGVDLAYCLKITANPATVTVHYSVAPATGNSIFVEGDQFSGVVSIDPTLQGISNASGVNPVTSGNFTPKTANNMIYGITDVSATTVSAGTNVAFTLRSNGSSSGGNITGISTETFLQGAAAAVAVTFGDTPASSFSSTVFWIALSPVAQPISFIPDISQIPYRQHQDYGMLARSSKQDEQWPFTAVPTPGQLGWEWRPEFARLRFRPSRSADEEYPFTAVPTPAQFGWDNPERFPLRIRPIPRSNADEQWPFTAIATPAQTGWEWRPEFARSRWQRFHKDEDVTTFPNVAVTPTQFGWDNPERFPLRRRLPPLTVQDEEWPFTAIATPAQFGWDNPEKFPLRIRFRPVLSADEEYPFTAAVTPTQFGWQIEPFFPQRLRFRPLVPAEQLLAPIPGTTTPTNIDFAYPPEFYTERRRYQPLVYEFWQPDIPPVSPRFQVMSGLAVKTKARTGATYITVTLQGTGVFVFGQSQAPTIFNEVLPFGSAHVVLTSGSIPVSVALGVSNDGVNFIQLGPALTSFPNIITLTATPTLNIPNLAPYKYHAWIVIGGDATTLLTITELFVGWRA